MEDWAVDQQAAVLAEALVVVSTVASAVATAEIMALALEEVATEETVTSAVASAVATEEAAAVTPTDLEEAGPSAVALAS